MTKFLTGAACAVLALSLLPASAQDEAAPPPQPSCEGAPYTDFAFWVGEWDVYNPQGQMAGENSITLAENGCLMIERWTGAGGGTGQSYNFYDPGMGKWRQVWVARGATIDYAGGLNDAGQMVLEGTIAYRAGRTAPFRGTWTLQDDGTVLQEFHEYNEAEDSWGDWFTGLYVPEGSEPPAVEPAGE